MSKLKKSKVIVNNKINPKFIPNFKPGVNTFQLLFYFRLEEPKSNDPK